MANLSSPQPAKPIADPSEPFEHPLVLRQSNLRSRLILALLMGVTVFAVIWACFAKLEESIPVQGKLEPKGAAKNIQVPVNGVIQTIHVKEGQAVKAGDRLVSLDPTASQAQLDSLKKIRTNLEQENRFYQAQLNGAVATPTALKIPPQMENLTRSRAAILAENRLAEAQLSGSAAGASLSLEQQSRLQAEANESQTRTLAAELEVTQLQQQIQLLQVRQRAAERSLAVEDRILQDLLPLAEQGGIARVQVLKQQQARDGEQTKIEEIIREKARLQSAVIQAQAKLDNTTALDTEELTQRIGQNTQRLAEIDSQISKVMAENTNRIAEIDSQISQSQQMLRYSEIRAPVDGVVFNLKPNAPGFVANSTEPILVIVPNTDLVAQVVITNKDIGFVRPGMEVEVRIDSFPFSEFGDVAGTLESIGSDALPPTQTQPYYTFPAKIKLKTQTLNTEGKQIQLQSGMSVSANIKVRDRTVMSIFTDTFAKTSESLKFVR
jgi:hemolysin D